MLKDFLWWLSFQFTLTNGFGVGVLLAPLISYCAGIDPLTSPMGQWLTGQPHIVIYIIHSALMGIVFAWLFCMINDFIFITIVGGVLQDIAKFINYIFS
jgi:hypothetical protein